MADARHATHQAGLPDTPALASTGAWLRRAGASALLACLLQLGACGGGGDAAPVSAAPPAPPTPPVAADPTPPAPPVAAGPAPASYRLVWADEFDTPGLPDATRWTYDTARNRLGWYNNERQYYAAARAENSRVADGKLHITARLEELRSASDWGGQRYTSARLITRGQAAWTYGFFEIRAKLPCGRGTWPAIWMLGTGGVWPDDGEIDIMEQTGQDKSRVLGTIHTRAYNYFNGTIGVGQGASTALPNACTAFHDYQLHWTASEIAVGVDGVVYFRYPNPGTGRDRWPFNAPQYLLLNIAIGGDLGGAIDDGIFPVTMEIEHVRVWQAP